ncbi:hypothetical protein PAUR_a3415 [Pseudoalteromonas aurantia 208]|uniref:Lipase n=1 Tax=Pseudoalteromonas aurantia 208 TaxID=1314867 RepID=A0ABR9E6I8_9GAMM|nr:hypothetical protein [Pseudoalteromonas aurantia 208]
MVVSINQQYLCGVKEIQWRDQVGVNIAALWYPTHTHIPSQPYLGVYQSLASPNAPTAPGRFPLIVLMHGSEANRYSHAYLAQALAQCGLVVVAPQMEALTAEREQIWRRSGLCSSVLSFLSKNEQFSSVIDLKHVGFIGHSIGGFAGALLAGAQPNFLRHKEFAGVHGANEKVDFKQVRDRRFHKFLLLDPALSDVLELCLLDGKAEVGMVYSELEDARTFGPPKNYKHIFPDMSYIHCLKQCGHFVYNHPSPKVFQKLYPQFCTDRYVSRQDVHKLLIKKTLGFFAGFVLNKYTAKPFMTAWTSPMAKVKRELYEQIL